MAVKTGQKQDGRFPKGQSGNPGGRPKGTRNAATVAMETLLDGQGQALTSKAIELALAGDITALRLLPRSGAAGAERPAGFLSLPPIKTPQDAASTISAVLAAVANGELTPSDANEISKLIDVYIETFKTAEFERRLSEVEKRQQQ